MKKISSIFIILFMLMNNAFSQKLHVDLSYKYIFANQWDKAIQMYNFSRPFLSEPQPLLVHGVCTSVSMLFHSQNKLQHGIGISHTFCRSVAENENLDNTLNLHLLNLAYVLHYTYAGQEQGLYSELAVGATGSGLFRRVNGEALESDDTSMKAFGIGADLCLKTGYRFQVSKKLSIAPFAALGCTPYLYAPKSESVINQTQGLSSKDHTSLWSAQIGCGLFF